MNPWPQESILHANALRRATGDEVFLSYQVTKME